MSERADIAEGTVISWTGKSIEVEFGGLSFKIGIGITRAMKASPPKPGTEILFSHYGRTDRGVPRRAVMD
jgi:hypothetical protein